MFEGLFPDVVSADLDEGGMLRLLDAKGVPLASLDVNALARAAVLNNRRMLHRILGATKASELIRAERDYAGTRHVEMYSEPRIAATRISIKRAEYSSVGSAEYVFLAQPNSDIWLAADETLASWARELPSDMTGYAKQYVLVTFADGFEYSLRFDLYPLTKEYPSIADEIVSGWRFYAGLQRPMRQTQEEYESFLADVAEGRGATRATALRYLHKYEVPERVGVKRAKDDE